MFTCGETVRSVPLKGNCWVHVLVPARTPAPVRRVPVLRTAVCSVWVLHLSLPGPPQGAGLTGELQSADKGRPQTPGPGPVSAVALWLREEPCAGERLPVTWVPSGHGALAATLLRDQSGVSLQMRPLWTFHLCFKPPDLARPAVAFLTLAQDLLSPAC